MGAGDIAGRRVRMSAVGAARHASDGVGYEVGVTMKVRRLRRIRCLRASTCIGSCFQSELPFTASIRNFDFGAFAAFLRLEAGGWLCPGPKRSAPGTFECHDSTEGSR